MHFPLYLWIATAVEILIVGYAIWRGGRPERIAAIALLIGIIITPLSADYRFLPGPQYGLAIIDVIFLAVLVWLVIRFGRPWSMVAAAFQLIIAAAHIVLVFDHRIHVWIYIAMLNLMGYAMVLSIAYGTWQADRRRFAARAENTG